MNSLRYKKGVVTSQALFGTVFINSKKGISPVVATALLLVVVVVAVIGFQGWFVSYLSGDFVKIEQQTSGSSSGDIRLEKIIDNTLWIINNIAANYSIDKLEIDGNVCNNISNLSLGLTSIDVSDCIVNITSASPSVVMYTENKIIEKYFYVPDAVIASNEGVSLSSSLFCTTDTDGDGQILWTCALYPMTDISFEGYLDVNDINSSIIDYRCWLKDDKSSCVGNFVVDGCGVGTVMDMGTNLCWQRNMSSYLDYNGTALNWTDAKTYCGNLNLGGHTNWNLPTKEELMSITDLSRSGPAIVGGNNNKFQNVGDAYYWTISTYGPSTGYAWIVTFNGGSDYVLDKSNPYYVTCVVRD